MNVNRASSSSRPTSPLRGSIQSKVRIVTHRTPEGDSVDTKIAHPESFTTETEQEQSTNNFRVQYTSFIAGLKAGAINFVDFEFLPEKKCVPKGYKFQNEWYDQANISKVSFDGMRVRGFSISGIILLETAFQIRQNGYHDLVNKEILQILKPDEKFLTRVKNIKNSFERIGYTLSTPCNTIIEKLSLKPCNDIIEELHLEPCNDIIEELHLEPEQSLWNFLEERMKRKLEENPQ